MKPYMAKTSNQLKRGHLSPGGDSLQEETPESLIEGLECTTHKVVLARPLAKGGRVTLITFEGHTIPKKARFLCEAIKVASYKPRPIVCHNCHNLQATRRASARTRKAGAGNADTHTRR